MAKEFVVVVHLQCDKTFEIPCSSLDICRVEVRNMVSNGGITVNSSSSFKFYPLSTVQYVEALPSATKEEPLVEKEKKAVGAVLSGRISSPIIPRIVPRAKKPKRD